MQLGPQQHQIPDRGTTGSFAQGCCRSSLRARYCHVQAPLNPLADVGRRLVKDLHDEEIADMAGYFGTPEAIVDLCKAAGFDGIEVKELRAIIENCLAIVICSGMCKGPMRGRPLQSTAAASCICLVLCFSLYIRLPVKQPVGWPKVTFKMLLWLWLYSRPLPAIRWLQERLCVLCPL